MSELLTTAEVIERLKLSKTSFYRLMSENDAPSPVMLGVRKKRWNVADINSWLASR